MRVKMLKTTPGSPDGLLVLNYLEGEVYTLTPALYRAFVEQMGVAEPLEVKVKPDPGALRVALADAEESASDFQNKAAAPSETKPAPKKNKRK